MTQEEEEGTYSFIFFQILNYFSIFYWLWISSIYILKFSYHNGSFLIKKFRWKIQKDIQIQEKVGKGVIYGLSVAKKKKGNKKEEECYEQITCFHSTW